MVGGTGESKEGKPNPKIEGMSNIPEKSGPNKEELMEDVEAETNPVVRLEKLLAKKFPDDYKNYTKDKNTFIKVMDFLKTVDELSEKDLKNLKIKAIKTEIKEELIDTAVNMSKDLLLSGELDDSYVFNLFKYYKLDEKFAKKVFENVMKRKPWFILSKIELPKNYGEEYTKKIIKDAVELAIKDENKLKENAPALFQYSHLFSGESYAENALMKAVEIVPRAAFEWMNGFIREQYAGKVLAAAASKEPLLAFDMYDKYKNKEWAGNVINAAAKADARAFFEYENRDKYERENFYPKVIKDLASSNEVNANIVLENSINLPGAYTSEIVGIVGGNFPKVLDDFPGLKQLYANSDFSFRRRR